MLWLMGCLDYTIEEAKNPISEMDTASEGIFDNEGNTEEENTESILASAKIYANTSGSLYEVDPDNGAISFIGDFMGEDGPVDHFEDIAIDLSGHMFGGTGDFLYLINPSTAEVRKVCSLDLDTTALTFTSDGALIVGAENTLKIVDIEDCTIQTLIAASFYDTSGDIVGLPDGFLYWSVYGGVGENDRLIRVDPNSGSEELIGTTETERLYGMGFANDQLYGFASDGSVVRMDSREGQSVLVAQHDNLSWWGATTNPVVWED